jgi:hypothetical protein
MYMNRNRRMHGCRHRFKRLIMSILVLSMLLTVTGCGGASQTAGSRLNTQNAVDKVLNQKTGDGDVESKSSVGATTETESASVTEATSEPTCGQVVNGDSSVIAQYKSEGVDVDLTLMGSDLVYATVYQMMSKPEEYEGKTIRIEGKYYASYYPITDKYYNYCLIADALACCSQGLEFELGGGAVYPGDYPADQSEVIVTGVFETYTEEAGQTFYYCRLRDAEYQLVSTENQ